MKLGKMPPGSVPSSQGLEYIAWARSLWPSDSHPWLYFRLFWRALKNTDAQAPPSTNESRVSGWDTSLGVFATEVEKH